MSNRVSAVTAAIVAFLVWTAATWFLEGRIQTFLRPDVVVDRLVYTLVANVLIGTVGALVTLRLIVRGGTLSPESSGFGSLVRTGIGVAAGLALGLGFYALSGGPTADPVVIANAFAQVLVVSAAEVVVCWALIAGVLAGALRAHGRWVAIPGAAAAASLLFGLYHFAHSPPFNTIEMVAFLSGIGLMTSAFFFVFRDVYGTIVFHNFLGVLGVLNALSANGRLGAFAEPQVPLFATALFATAVLILADRFVLRRGERAGGGHSRRGAVGTLGRAGG
jgi:hypothetical protein